jgi:hypothetical protein
MYHSGIHERLRYLQIHAVITNKEYMIWYMSITCRVITPDLEQIPLSKYMQCE